tara:strand:- start:573 stop:824 length:252 start_codon:yes stop_codon:yes gene_type:complete
VDKNSEAWRAECEARFIAKLPYDRRIEWLRVLDSKRGEAATKKIRERISELLDEAGGYSTPSNLRPMRVGQADLSVRGFKAYF